METAESATRRVSRNSSHFKKLLADESVTNFDVHLEEDSIEVNMPTASFPFCPRLMS